MLLSQLEQYEQVSVGLKAKSKGYGDRMQTTKNLRITDVKTRDHQNPKQQGFTIRVSLHLHSILFRGRLSGLWSRSSETE
jgi:hypothetical protein